MEFDPQRELKNLMDLLEMERNFKRSYYETSLNSAISDNFLDYPNRSTFTSYSQMVEFVGLNIYNITEQLFAFSEFLVDIFCNLAEKFTEEESEFVQIIFDNITRFLELSNHELITLENGAKIIVEKNVYASEVSQIVSETSIEDAIKILEYNHFSNKGNIQRKKEILIALANYLEPFRRELNYSEELKDIMKVNNQKVIAFEKLFEMYNNFGLRHNNSNQYHLDLADDELEQWYDDIYTSTLFVILSIDESRILSKLKTLREG
jgi:conserved domain protein